MYTFTERIAYDTWVAERMSDNTFHQLRVLYSVPILFLFTYLYDPHHHLLCQAYPNAWSANLSARYFPAVKPAPATFNFPRPFPPDVDAWYSRKISYEYYYQRVCPHRQLSTILATISGGGNTVEQFRKLVWYSHDVSVTALYVFVTDETLLMEAQILYEIRQLMKRFGTVFLHEQESLSIRTKWRKRHIDTLTGENIISKSEDGLTLALSWAAAAHQTFMEIEGNSTARFIHDPTQRPVELSKATFTIGADGRREYRYDKTRAVDLFVDYKNVAITMINAPWESVVTEPVIPTTVATCVREGLDKIRTSVIRRRTLCISVDGHIFLDDPLEYTVRVVGEPFPVQYPLASILTLYEDPAAPTMFNCSSRTAPHAVYLDRSMCFAKTKRAASCTFEESASLQAGEYDAVVLIGNRITHPRWKREALRIANDQVPCMFICVGKPRVES